MSSSRRAGGVPNSADIVREVAGIARAPGAITERAEALLALLQRAVPYDAAVLTLLPPDQREHVSLARSGYDDRVCGFLDGPALQEELELVGLRRSRRPLLLRDLSVPAADLVGWGEYMEPAGFRDSLGVGLFTPQGACLGVLGLVTRTASGISEGDRDLLGLLATPIADAVDPWRRLATIAGLIQRAVAGVVLTLAGAVVPLPGLPDHRLLAPGGAVLAVAPAQLAAGNPYASFLAPLPAAGDLERSDGMQTHVLITVLAAPRHLQRFAAAVVLVAPPPDLHGLTPRELDVLGWLVTGASDERIARGLDVSVRTVEVHVDHLRAKLAAGSRTMAAARALRLGLFVPAALFGSGT